MPKQPANPGSPPTYDEYKEMGRIKLRREVKNMLAQQARIMALFNKHSRAKLLIAMQALHDIAAQPGKREHDPDNPNWEGECELLGITPELFRQWKHRTQSETDMRILAGEQKKLHPKAKLEADTQAELATAKRFVEKLSRAVIEGKEEEAERVASAAAEHYGF